MQTPVQKTELGGSGHDRMTSENDSAPSHAQISHALSSKDPSWFRQTADRGTGSLALRKNAEETMSDNLSHGGGMRLPGLSRESTAELEKPMAPDFAGDRSRSPSRASSTFGTNSVGNRFSSMSSVSTTGGLGSPLPLTSAHRLDARKADLPQAGSDDRTPLSPGRGSPERSGSPTKGLGGFVQSAMLKRSDSISKRWSTQAPPGLSRSNSIMSNRSGVGRPGFGDVLTNPAEMKIVRESSPFSASRPGSSHSEATVVHHMKGGEELGPTENRDNKDHPRADNGFVRPSLPAHARSLTTSSVTTDDAKIQDADSQTPRSPSRNIDTRRWSPTKATWLESALNRPESPRPKSQVAPPPAWLRDLSKTRQSKASVDLGNPSGYEVTPVGLMRSPPPGSHYKKPSISGIGETIGGTIKGPDSEPKSPATEPPNESSTSTKDEPQQPSVEPQVEPRVESRLVSEPSATKSPPPIRSPKPDLSARTDLAPPKPKQQSGPIDFRSSLRKRETVNDSTIREEPEFKNVFGKLRKAEKSNYKAPDELKQNIVRGKSALNVTGGPKKTERVDELKESILKQKDAMKAGGGSIRRTTSEEERAPPKPAKSIPEAISKRQYLSRVDSANVGKSAIDAPPTSDHAPVKSSPNPPLESFKVPERIVSASSRPVPAEDAVPSMSSPPDNMSLQSKQRDEGTNEPSPGPGIAPAEMMQKDAQEGAVESVRPSPSSVSVGATEVVATGKGLATKGNLADRLNPGLANFLSRGPPRGEESEKSKTTALSSESSSAIREETTDSSPSAPLSHMTKGRARGPKRRLPGAGPPVATSQKHFAPELESSTESNAARPDSRPKPTAEGLVLTAPEVSSTPTVQKKPILERQKPVVATKSPELNRPSFTPSAPPPNLGPKQALQRDDLETLSSKRYTGPEVPAKTSPSIHQKDATLQTTRSNERPTPPPKSATLPLTPSPGNSSPSPSFTSKLKESFANSTPLPPLQSKVGLGLGASVFQSRQDVQQEKGSRPAKVSASPPVPPKKFDISLETSIDQRRPSLTSPVPRTSESARVISNFFNALPKSSDRVEIDPQLVLSAEIHDPKTRTRRKQIWEITGDGKKQDLPASQEYILFEGSMYLCVHAFESSAGKRSDAYLWCGDEVGEAAIEDAQLFARKVARDNGCKLELLRQGKETASFVQALGGIIITRRGSSSRSSSSALYMLCGRRHLSQIAFDEVDFARQHLCSGFPFVISAKFGKLYLWKGKGSGADEIGSARLIGMDLGLTGEIEEVTEGQEPESFFEVFPDPATTSPSPMVDHWHLKPKHEKYRCRLLKVDHELGQGGSFWNRRGSSSPVTRPNDTVQEIEAFCQKDLQARGIYILDAFFEIYV